MNVIRHKTKVKSKARMYRHNVAKSLLSAALALIENEMKPKLKREGTNGMIKDKMMPIPNFHLIVHYSATPSHKSIRTLYLWFMFVSQTFGSLNHFDMRPLNFESKKYSEFEKSPNQNE